MADIEKAVPLQTSRRKIKIFINFAIKDSHVFKIPDIHINIFEISETIVPLESKTPLPDPKAMNESDTIRYVKEKGGYITLNHYNNKVNPNGGLGVPYTYEQLNEWGVDGFEIVNRDHVQEKEIGNFV